MKNIILLTLCCFLFQISNAQKADMSNAPLNPLGFKWHKDQYGLKGDIYASGEKKFDRNGNIIVSYGTEYYYENGKLIGNNYGDTYKTDARGNVIEQRFNNKSNYYTFNNQNLLIKEENIYDEVNTHTYDNQGRISKSVVVKKGDFFQQRDYSYEKKGDVLIVTIKYTESTTQDNNFIVKYHYKDGFLIKEELQNGTYQYETTVDKKGNKIDFHEINRVDAKHVTTYNRYYDEKDKSGKLEFGYYKSSPAALPKPSMYKNGKRMLDIEWAKGIHPDEQVAYDGLKNVYYSVSNVEDLKKDVTKRVPVTKIIARNMPNITYSFDGNFIVYIKGRSSIKKRNFAFMGPHLIDYRIEKTVGRTFIVDDYRGKTEDIKELKLLSKDTTNVFYLRDLTKDNFLIIVDGSHIDYTKARFEYLTNGDPVIFIDDKPLYILSEFKAAKDKEVYLGTFYNGELDKKGKSTIAETTTETNEITEEKKSTDYACVKGDCENGWGRVTVNNIITDATFKDGAINGLAYISYPNGGYYHGQYVNNRRHGVGYYKWENGNVYIGGWKGGKQHGLGYTMNKENSITSGGIFEDGKLIQESATDYLASKTSGKCMGNCVDGFGKYTYNNGDIYWGFFKDGNRYGVGTYLWSNKSAYTGAYMLGGKRNGYGIYTYVDRSVFKGIFVDDRIDGLGVMKYNESGDIAQGVFNNKGAKVKDF